MKVNNENNASLMGLLCLNFLAAYYSKRLSNWVFSE